MVLKAFRRCLELNEKEMLRKRESEGKVIEITTTQGRRESEGMTVTPYIQYNYRGICIHPFLSSGGESYDEKGILKNNNSKLLYNDGTMCVVKKGYNDIEIETRGPTFTVGHEVSVSPQTSTKDFRNFWCCVLCSDLRSEFCGNHTRKSCISGVASEA